MPDGAVTVDELAIRVAANADTAAANIDLLTASLQRLAGILGPTLAQLSTLGGSVGRVASGAARATSGAAAAVPAVSIPTVTVPAAVNVASGAGAAASMAATNATLSRTGGIVNAVKSKVNSFTSSLTSMGKTGTKATSGLSGSFIQLRSWMFFALFGIGLLVKGFQSFIGQASASIETANLFGVAFGNMTDKALAWVNLASGNLGLDPAQMMKTSATFMDMSRSMGVTTEWAYLLSKGLTQLSYDYASLRDIPFDESAKKFQSALAGQTRAIRTLGLDVTQAALQEEIYREGLSYKITELNRASKSIILYNTLMRNSVRAQGDLARTLSSPANMMRVLGDTVKIAARAIGYLFIPLLRLALPWLIAIAQGALAAAQALGSFFGIKIPSWGELVNSMGGVSVGAADAEDSMGGVADNASKAADAVKRMKDYVLGIDELNILSPETPTTSAGGAGGGAGSAGVGGVAPGITPVVPYDFGKVNMLEKILAPIKTMFAAAAKALAPFIAAVKRVWEALKPFIKNVWQGFTEFFRNVLIPLAVWTMNTVGVWVLERVYDILKWFNDHPAAAKALGEALGVFVTLKGIDVFLGILGKVFGLLSGLFSIKFLGVIAYWVGAVIQLVSGMGGAIYSAFFVGGVGEGFAAIAAALGISVGWAVALVVGAVALIVGAGYLLWRNWDTVKTKATELWNWIVKAWDGIVKATKPAWDFIGGVFSWVSKLIKTVLLVTISLLLSAVIKAWNAISTATTKAWQWVYSRVKGPLTDVWNFVNPVMTKIGAKVSAVWGGLTNGLQGAWNTIRSIFKDGVNDIIHFINQGPIVAVNKLIDTANSLPGAGVVGKISHLDYIPLLAQGGMPTRGSVFVAGEAGPEVYGSFQGNTNTVMPLENSGFVEAMRGAVAQGVASVMNNLSLGGDGDIYLDGQKVGKVLRDSDRRAGISTSLVRVGG